MSTFFWILWRAVQTEQFGAYLSNKIKSTVYKKTSLSISFERVDISLLPPSTTMRGFRVIDEDNNISLKANYLGVSFGLVDLISPNLSIGEIYLNDALLNVKTDKSKASDKEFKVEELFSLYQEFYSEKMNVRIKRIKVENTRVNVDEKKLILKSFSASLFTDLLTSRASVENISFEKDNILLDQVDYEVQLNSEGLRIKEFQVLDKINSLNVMGKVIFKKKPEVNLLFKYDGGKDLKALKLISNIAKEIKNAEADISINGKVLGEIKNPKIECKVLLEGIKSKFVLLDRLEVNASYFQDEVFVKNISVNARGGSAKSTIEKNVYNIKTKSLYIKQIQASVKNLHSNDFLYILKEDLNALKLRFSGDLNISLEENGIRFQPEENAKISKAKLYNKKETEIIIEPNGDLIWLSGKGITVLKEKGVLIDARFKINESDLQASGKIDDQVNIKAISEKMNLLDVGPIAATTLHGTGGLAVDVLGPPNNIIFNTSFNIKDFNIVDMNLGEIEGEASLSLEQLVLNLNIKKGKFNSTLYEGAGRIAFSGNDNLNLNAIVKNGSFKDIEKIAPKIFNNIKTYTKPFNSSLRGSINIFGGFKKNLLGVKGHIEGSGKYQKELIDSFKLNYKYHKEKLALNKINMKKSKGRVTGKVSFDFPQDSYNYSFKLQNFFLRDSQNINDIGLGYDGKVDGLILGDGSSDNPNFKIDLKVVNGKIGDYEVADSIVSIHRSGEEYYLRSNIFDGEVVFNSFLNFNKNKRSTLDFKINTSDLRKILGVVSLHNLNDPEMNGELSLNIKSDFSTSELLGLNATAQMDKFRWFKKNENLELSDPMFIEINKGVIKKWNLSTNALNRNSFTFVGEGDLQNKVKIDSNFKLASVFADVLTERLNFRGGDLAGRLRIIGEKGTFSTYLYLVGEKIDLKTIGLRTPFSDLSFKVIIDGKRINLNRFESKLGGGNLLASGNGELRFPIPKLDLLIDAKNIRQPVFKKSYFIFDSTVSLRGNKLPYLVSGQANVKEAIVRDELKDMKDDSLIDQGYRKYIPKSALESELSPLELDLNASFSNPIMMKNSLLDISLDGNINLSNTLKNTLYEGQLNLNKNKNILYLKGHEFIFNEGNIKLSSQQEEQVMALDFLAEAKINEYDVFTKIKGNTSDLDIDMYSRPDLSQGDLLSLVTLGVTSDVSQNLGERERQSVTTLGIGGLVLDQLGINQNLNKSFGLKVSVAPDIEEDEGSLLRGRAEGAGNEASMRTGTKIQVKKEVAEKVDLSLSSTVGGAARQKQEMNIDVKINEAFSLEGIYEVRSTDELEEENPDSIGADLKWRFSF